jgi:hypothetical protein
VPVFRVNGQLCYFAHVPKCGGSAVELYLQERFGELAFRDEHHLMSRPSQRWTKGSPQHIAVDALDRLLPPSYFTASFALVRHPAKRLLSVFLYQRDIERTLQANADIGKFLADLLRRWRRNPFYLDNHPRPMADLVPKTATVFRLEDGTEQVVTWLDRIAKNEDGPRTVPRINSYRQQLYHRRLEPGPQTKLTPENHAQITELYASDFERFGYTVANGTTAGTGR